MAGAFLCLIVGMYIVVRGTRHLENVQRELATVPICCRRLWKACRIRFFVIDAEGKVVAWNVAFVRLSGWDPVKHAALTREQLCRADRPRCVPFSSRSSSMPRCPTARRWRASRYDGRDYEVSRGEMSGGGLSCAVSTSPRSCATRRPCARARRWRRPASSRAAWRTISTHPAGHPGEPRPGEGRGQCRSGGAGAPQRGQRGGRSGRAPDPAAVGLRAAPAAGAAADQRRPPGATTWPTCCAIRSASVSPCSSTFPTTPGTPRSILVSSRTPSSNLAINARDACPMAAR